MYSAPNMSKPTNQLRKAQEINTLPIICWQLWQSTGQRKKTRKLCFKQISYIYKPNKECGFPSLQFAWTPHGRAVTTRTGVFSSSDGFGPPSGISSNSSTPLKSASSTSSKSGEDGTLGSKTKCDQHQEVRISLRVS